MGVVIWIEVLIIIVGINWLAINSNKEKRLPSISLKMKLYSLRYFPYNHDLFSPNEVTHTN